MASPSRDEFCFKEGLQTLESRKHSPHVLMHVGNEICGTGIKEIPSLEIFKQALCSPDFAPISSFKK